MACIRRPTLNKIPGLPVAKKESYTKDLTKLNQIELLELKEREEKLLKNKSKLLKLPDKGKRVQDFYDKVLQEIDRRCNIDEAAKKFSNLNIASVGEKTINELEWQGDFKKFDDSLDPSADVLDSDDESKVDPLKIIVNRQMHSRRTKIEEPDIKLITDEDIKEIDSFKNDFRDSDVLLRSDTCATEVVPSIEAEIISIDVKEKLDVIRPKLQTLNNNSTSINGESRSSSSCSHTLDIEPHVHYLVDKTETQVKGPAKERFKPFRTTVSNVHDPSKERCRGKSIHWEITAATPPPLRHNGTQLLSLMDSVEIQAQYIRKLKELQEKQARERLAAKLKSSENCKLRLPSTEVLKTKDAYTKYRDSYKFRNIEGEPSLNEDDEVQEFLYEEKLSSLNYTVCE